jgi:hypothetical protein
MVPGQTRFRCVVPLFIFMKKNGYRTSAPLLRGDQHVYRLAIRFISYFFCGFLLLPALFSQ